jgi:8-oxo-dGTP pyrophosphatase MutT (NUDIX family)
MDFGAGFFPIARKDDTPLILIGKRSSKVTYPLQYCNIGGGKEEDERPIATAKREFSEETQYNGKFSNIQLLNIQQKSKNQPLYYLYICHISYFVPVPDHENEEIIWVTLPELKKIKPKHFGLDMLLSDQGVMNKITKYLEDVK